MCLLINQKSRSHLWHSTLVQRKFHVYCSEEKCVLIWTTMVSTVSTVTVNPTSYCRAPSLLSLSAIFKFVFWFCWSYRINWEFTIWSTSFSVPIFLRGFIVSLSQQRSRPTCSLPIWIYLSTFIVSINYLSTLIVSITPTTMSPPPLLCHEICPKYCTAWFSGQNFYTANFTYFQQFKL